MKKFGLSVILLVVMVSGLCVLSACNEPSKPKVILIDNKEAYSVYYISPKKDLGGGTNNSIIPSVSLIADKAIEYIKYEASTTTVNTPSNRNAAVFKLSEYKPTADEKYKNFNYYTFPMEIIPAYVESGKVTSEYKDFVINIDGTTYKNNNTYRYTVFGDEKLIYSPNGMFISNCSSIENETFTFTATEDIKMLSISFTGIGLELYNNETLFSDLPEYLNKEDSYSFSFDCKLKDGIESGGDYFILEYKKAGEDRIRYSPFGFFTIEKDNMKWQKVADAN